MGRCLSPAHQYPPEQIPSLDRTLVGFQWQHHLGTFTLLNLVKPMPGSALNGYWTSDAAQHINFIGDDGHVHELYIHPGAGWADNDLTAFSGHGVTPQPGSPLTAYTGTDNSQHVIFVGTDNHIHELYIHPGAGWSNNDLTAFTGNRVLPAVGSPLHGYWGDSNSQHINFVGSDGHLHELYILPNSNGWQLNDLTQAANVPALPRLNTPLGGFSGPSSSQHVHFLGTDGRIHEIYANPGAGWAHNDLTAASKCPVLSSPLATLCSYIGPGDSQHVDFVGADNHVHEIYANAGAGWAHNDLTAASGNGIGPAQGSALHGYPGSDASQHVNFVGTDGRVHELYAHPGANWSNNDLIGFSGNGVAPAQGTKLAGYWGSDASQHVIFLGTDNHVHELYIHPNAPWTNNDILNGQLGAKTQKDLDIAGAVTGDLAPISCFELNLVGHDSSQTTVFSSGAGSITYTCTEALTPVNTLPSCTQGSVVTAERSNSRYGTLTDAASNTIVQTLSVGPTVLTAPKELRTRSTPAPH